MTPKRFKWLELIIRQPQSEEEAVKAYVEKVTNQYRLKILGHPVIYWQGNLFDKKPDCIVKCRVTKQRS
jgi:hypothetical protein